jgi:hypothetical protein
MSSTNARQRYPQSGGRIGRAVLLAPLAVLLLLLLPACGGGSGSLDDMLRLLPDDADGAVFIDVNALYDDDDLRSLRRDAEDRWDSTDMEDEFDIDLEDLSYVVYGKTEGDDLFLLGGIEDLDDLRDELDDLDYDEDEIRDTEVWIDTSRQWEAVAFLDGGVVLIAEYEDTMEDALRQRGRESSSLYSEAEEIVSDLPDAVIALVTGCGRDCLGGMAVEKDGSDDMKLLQVMLHEAREDAEDAEDDFKDDLEDDDLPGSCRDAAVDRDGRKVTFEMACATNYFRILVNFNF